MRYGALLGIAVLSLGSGGCTAIHKCGFRGCPEDHQITAAVESLFAQHPVLRPPNLVYVNALNHVVYLSGQVNTDLERTIADRLARQAPGVTAVRNNIALGYP